MATTLTLGSEVFHPSDDPDAFAAEHRRLGFRAGVCPEVSIDDGDRLRAIEAAFARHGVRIAEVWAWRNIMTPDEGARRENLAFVTHQMAVAEAVGAACCVDIAGSFDGDTLSGPHPRNLGKDFFDGTVENCRAIIDAVRPTRTAFTIEMKGWNLPDGPDSYLALIKAVDRPAFGVHMDPFNTINSPYRYYDSAGFIRENFEKLGPWIKSCHAKDLEWVPGKNVHFRETIPGRGGIDYAAYVTEVARWGVPLVMEHLATNDEYQEGRRYICAVAASVGIEVA